MGRLRIALSIAGDLASLLTMVLFVLVALAVAGAIRVGRLVPAAANAAGVAQLRQPRPVSQPAHGRIPLLSGTEHFPSNARIALIEFGDFECQYCAQFDRVVLPQLKAEFVDTGYLAFIYRDFPLPNHRRALQASRAASCADAQGRYWEMHTRFFARPNQFLPDELLAYARELNLDVRRFATCVSANTPTKIDADRNLGNLLGVSATPTFFLGQIVDGAEVELKWQLLGAQPIEAFREIITRSNLAQ